MAEWWRWRRVLVDWWLTRQSERLTMAIAWRMPRYLVYWCGIRLVASATQGKYGDTIVPELTAMDAIQRWRLR